MTEPALHPPVHEIFDPGSAEYRKCPYAAYEVGRRDMPVAHHEGFDEWIVTGREELDAVLRDPGRFTSRHNLEGSYPFSPESQKVLDGSLFFQNAIYNVEPPAHTRFRNLISEYFTPRSLRRLEPSIREISRRLAGELAGAGHGDLLQQLAYPLPYTVICDLIGIPAEDRDTVKLWNDTWLGLQVVPMEPEQQLQAAQTVPVYEAYLRDLLAQRVEQPTDDLATGLARASRSEDPVCTEDQAVVALRFMIAAGHETTTNLIANTVHQLLKNRELWESVVADPTLIGAAVEETLRIDSSVQGALRVTTEDVTVGATKLPAGARLRVMFAAAGMDPDWVDDPDVFRLDRPGLPQHLSFGQGMHFCAGAALARLEARIAVETLVELAPDLRLRDGFEPEYLPGGFIFHALSELPLTRP
ncbi:MULTISPECIES: cytochrome P450 [unclassified Streptomyces]|uniref:cytochrome P450 n=1 Tax=unclassified Streptomyces TaxID=2593676 RepID=UPI0022509E56|nr:MULTISPECIES: cytochrome P450 [unclassified Streptomyces]MCX5143894.1 cytochrome P450 [Streptomyces sp. NBC_00338]WRZ68308.1 cytochrome P450 [Streptomyces sp. NBC_01257]